MTELHRYRCLECGETYEFPNVTSPKECNECHALCERIDNDR